MLKLSIRFFLALCVFLLGQYGPLHAHTRLHHSIGHLIAKHTRLVTAPSSHGHFQRDRPGTKKGTHKFYITDNENEEDDDDLVALKKHPETSRFFDAVFNPYFYGYSDIRSNNRITATKYPISSSSPTYLRLLVIRI